MEALGSNKEESTPLKWREYLLFAHTGSTNRGDLSAEIPLKIAASFQDARDNSPNIFSRLKRLYG